METIFKISVGKPTSLERKLGFNLYGWVPDFIQLRVRGIQSSGVLEWWNKLVAVHLVIDRENSERLWSGKDYRKGPEQVPSHYLIQIVFSLVILYGASLVLLLFEFIVCSFLRHSN